VLNDRVIMLDICYINCCKNILHNLLSFNLDLRTTLGLTCKISEKSSLKNMNHMLARNKGMGDLDDNLTREGIFINELP